VDCVSGGIRKADIASAVHESAVELASRVRPGRQCLVYSVAGAMVATEALGGRYVLQVGGYQFWNDPVTLSSCGPAWVGRAPKSELDLHCWFARVPPGADPEDSWRDPPWLNVADLWLRNLGPVNAGKGIHVRPLPDFVWGPVDRVRELSGVEFRPDRESAVRFLGIVTEGPDSDYWMEHLRIAADVANAAARKLGLPRLSITADVVVPKSFMSRWPAPDPGV
jgi:hypothetical protein